MFDKIVTYIKIKIPDYIFKYDDFMMTQEKDEVVISKWNLPFEKPSKESLNNIIVSSVEKEITMKDLLKRIEDIEKKIIKNNKD